MALLGNNEGASSSTQRRILHAALGVFAEFGYAGATTREIARRAQVHQPAIAYHFDNKEQLWKAAVRAVFTDFATELEAGVNDIAGATDPLRRLASVYVRFVARNPEWVMFVIHEGQQIGDRSRWLVEEWLGPQARRLYEAMTGNAWPEGDGAAVACAVSLLAVLTGSMAIFAQRAQILQMDGVDTHSAAFIDQHVETTFQVLAALTGKRSSS